MGNNITLYLKQSNYVGRFLRRFINVLEVKKLIHFYFCDDIVTWRRAAIHRGVTFDHLSEYSNTITHVITDNMTFAKFLSSRLDMLTSKVATLYAKQILFDSHAVFKLEKPPTRALLWASRMDNQKRPELVLRIADAIRDNNMNITIHMFGAPVTDNFDVQIFLEGKNIRYHGGYKNFKDIIQDDYDAFLYTSRFDGLPNVLLEAMSAGLPVIAPNIGGIAEAVTAETGILVEDTTDDELLISRYIEAIRAIYDEQADLTGRGRAARQRIVERHSETAHIARVAEILGITTECCNFQEPDVKADQHG